MEYKVEKYIIKITSPDGAAEDYCGTFEDEQLADDFCRQVLEPRLKGSKFHITTVESPLTWKGRLSQN